LKTNASNSSFVTKNWLISMSTNYSAKKNDVLGFKICQKE
jgi:hypothetical protein